MQFTLAPIASLLLATISASSAAVTSADLLNGFKTVDSSTRSLKSGFDDWDGSASRLIPLIRLFDQVELDLTNLANNFSQSAQLNAADSQTLVNYANSPYLADLKAFGNSLIAKRARVYATGAILRIRTELAQVGGNLTSLTNQLKVKVASASAAAASSVSASLLAENTRERDAFAGSS